MSLNSVTSFQFCFQVPSLISKCLLQFPPILFQCVCPVSSSQFWHHAARARPGGSSKPHHWIPPSTVHPRGHIYTPTSILYSQKVDPLQPSANLKPIQPIHNAENFWKIGKLEDWKIEKNGHFLQPLNLLQHLKSFGLVTWMSEEFKCSQGVGVAALSPLSAAQVCCAAAIRGPNWCLPCSPGLDPSTPGQLPSRPNTQVNYSRTHRLTHRPRVGLRVIPIWSRLTRGTTQHWTCSGQLMPPNHPEVPRYRSNSIMIHMYTYAQCQCQH